MKFPSTSDRLRRGRFRSDLERDYARRLQSLVQRGEIVEWRYEPMRLRLGDGGMLYTVDWLIHTPGDVIELHETKGYHPNIRDAITRWSAAGELYPWFQFVFVVRRRGRWERTDWPDRPRVGGRRR